ncbi:MAG: O-antigen ligase family protein [Bacteroidales bacterium]|nr:O-antigen ligase family protein [Bacteroidales bacterium]
MALVFFIPLYQRFIPWIIAAILLNWILEWNFKEKISRMMSDRIRKNNLLFIILYVIYVIGLFHTDNFKYALFDLEVKFSLLIFPILLSSIAPEAFERRFVFRTFLSFLSGAFIATLICIVLSILRFQSSHLAQEFYYSHLSVFLHPGYFSMYLNFAIAILFCILFERWEKLASTYKSIFIFMIAWFFLFVILLSSKAGILCLAIIFVVYIVYFILQRKKIFQALLMVFGITLAFWISFNIFPQSLGRLKQATDVMANSENIKNDTREGTGERILIWKSSIDIIKNNFLFGTGTGDVKDALLEMYSSKDISTAHDLKLNAHNQYLQIFISLGVIGFLVLILIFILPAIFALRSNNILYFLFIIIVSFNFLVESMLETQAGVIFYGFFNSYLFITQKRP